MKPAAGSWPHRVLMAAARREIPGRLLAHASDADWLILAKVASSHGTEGWLARELRGVPAVPPDFQIQLQAAAARVAANHRGRMRDARAALESLGGAGITAMILKGPALVERYYHDPSVRTYGDVDVFVPPQRFAAAVSVLESSGLSLQDRNWPLLLADLRGQLHFQSRSGGTIELHWHIVNASRQRFTLGMDVDEMWDAAFPDTLDGTRCHRLKPGDEIAHLCLHAAMHGCNRLVWLLDLAKIAESGEVDWDRTALRLQRWGFGAGGYLVLSLARDLIGAPIPLGDLRPLRPSGLTMAEHRRLIERWDLSEPERSSRLRELFLATAGDSVSKRLRLAYDIVVPPKARTGSDFRKRPLATLRRVTLGTVSRVAGKLGEHGEDHTGIEYEAVGDQRGGRDRYLAAIDEIARPASSRRRVVVFSPSPSIGMSHYARALADELAADAEVTLIDRVDRAGLWKTRMRLAKASRDPDSVLLVTSPHWSVPLLLQGAPRRGGFVFHDPILDAATPATRRLHVLYYRILSRRLGAVILHGDAFVDHVVELDLQPRRVIVVPHGFVPPELEIDRPYDPEGPLAFVGRFHPYKGLGVFAEAIRILAARGVHVPVIAAGDGLPPGVLPHAPSVETRSGELSDAEFRDAIGRCSAIVLPYERANQSGVLATAFRAGRPAIASAVGSFPQYIRDGENGLLVPPSDPVALAGALERFRADPEAASRMAEGARRTWDEELSPKRAAERILRTLVSVRVPKVR